MPLIGRPKVAKTLPKGLGAETIAELLRVIDEDCGSGRRSDWAERDRAIVLTAVLAGLRADKLVRADVGHIRLTDEGGVIHVHGKGNKDRRIPCGTGPNSRTRGLPGLPAEPLPRQHQTAAHQCRAGRLAGHCATVRRQ